MDVGELLRQPALWGIFGAFAPSNSDLAACLTAARGNGGTKFGCFMKFGSALAIGAIGAQAFGPWIADFLGRTKPHDLVAIATVIGLGANGTAPILVTLAPRFIDTLFAALKGKAP